MNTWHGIAINKMGNAVKNRTDFDWSNTDAVTISNDMEVDIYKRDFLANEKNLFKVGLPRNDKLYRSHNDSLKKFKHKHHIDPNKKLILYAPTWRDSSNNGLRYEMHPPINWKLWEEKLASKYHLILRMHPNASIKEQAENEIPFGSFVYDGRHDDIIDLMIVSDILISDYSSTIMDYSILERPIFCFAYDYDMYIESRGFYYDLDKELPNGVIKSEDVLLRELLNLDFERQIELSLKLKLKHAQYGGNATEEVLNLLYSWLDSEKGVR